MPVPVQNHLHGSMSIRPYYGSLFQKICGIAALPMLIRLMSLRHVFVFCAVSGKHRTAVDGNPAASCINLHSIQVPCHGDFLTDILIWHTVLVSAYLNVIRACQLHFLAEAEAERDFGEFAQCRLLRTFEDIHAAPPGHP